jgi:predicted  nucleic acid-binding Zn-ribbon protein
MPTITCTPCGETFADDAAYLAHVCPSSGTTPTDPAYLGESFPLISQKAQERGAARVSGNAVATAEPQTDPTTAVAEPTTDAPAEEAAANTENAPQEAAPVTDVETPSEDAPAEEAPSDGLSQ